MIKKYKKYLFLLLFGFFFIPKEAYAYDVHCYFTTDSWHVLNEGWDEQCYSGIFVQSNYCIRTIAIETQRQMVSGHNFRNSLTYSVDTFEPITQLLTGRDIGPWDIQDVNYSNVMRTPSQLSPNPIYGYLGNQIVSGGWTGPPDWYTKVFDVNTTFKSTNGHTQFGYYWYYHNDCMHAMKLKVNSWSLTDLSGAESDTNAIINNQNKNTQDIINNQNENQAQTNEKLDSIGDDLTDINDTLNDDSSVSSSELEDFFEDIPVISSGPISDLLLLPTYILNAFINRSNDTCASFGLDLPWGEDGDEMWFTCWTLSDYLDNYAGFVETILYVVMFYNIAMLVVSCWETWTNLSTDFASMYSSKGSSKTGGDK